MDAANEQQRLRQRRAAARGLPLEIYAFASDTRWVMYEGIQSDIFDHILAILPEFGLRVFQEPAGTDVRALTEAIPRRGARSTGTPGAG